MIADLKTYPVMKDSGVPWLGEIPEHWQITRARNAVDMRVSNVDKNTQDGELPVRLCNYVDVYKNDRITERLSFMQATATREEIERFRLAVNDVLITKDSEAWNDIGVPALVQYSAQDLVCGYHLALLRPRSELLNGSYLLRTLQCPYVAYQFHVEANGVTRYGLSHGTINNVLLPIPPLPEQAAIARFLDHHDRLVRRFIRAKRRQIELLNEQKQAIIQHAVTRGLDPNVRLKPSGVEWLGDVPEHWEMRRLRSLLKRVDQGVSPQAENRLAEPGAWGVLKAGCVNDGVFRDTEHKRLPDGFSIDSHIAVQVGDVLVSRASGSPRLVGSVGEVDILRYQLVLSDKTFRLVFSDPRIVQFVVVAMKSSYFRMQVEQAISGAEGLANNLPLSSLKDFVLAIPPADEARKIAKSLSSEILSNTEFILSVQREIELVREYQTRLVADVVTGKVDVRGVNLPEVDAGEVVERWEEETATGSDDAGTGVALHDDGVEV